VKSLTQLAPTHAAVFWYATIYHVVFTMLPLLQFSDCGLPAISTTLGQYFNYVLYLFNHTRIRPMFCPVFLSAVPAVAARCKLPFALGPGLSQERVTVSKEINKGKHRRKPSPNPRLPIP